MLYECIFTRHLSWRNRIIVFKIQTALDRWGKFIRRLFFSFLHYNSKSLLRSYKLETGQTADPQRSFHNSNQQCHVQCQSSWRPLLRKSGPQWIGVLLLPGQPGRTCYSGRPMWNKPNYSLQLRYQCGKDDTYNVCLPFHLYLSWSNFQPLIYFLVLWRMVRDRKIPVGVADRRVCLLRYICCWPKHCHQSKHHLWRKTGYRWWNYRC